MTSVNKLNRRPHVHGLEPLMLSLLEFLDHLGQLVKRDCLHIECLNDDGVILVVVAFSSDRVFVSRFPPAKASPASRVSRSVFKAYLYTDIV
jgi:hypothetical protein